MVARQLSSHARRRAFRNPITGIAGCCARAASGHAADAPPSSVMNSPRVIRLIFKPVKSALLALNCLGRSRPDTLDSSFVRAASFDHLVGAGEHARWNFEAEHLG